MKSRETMRLWGSSPPQHQQGHHHVAGGRRGRGGSEGVGNPLAAETTVERGNGGLGENLGVGCGGPAHRKSERWRRGKRGRGGGGVEEGEDGEGSDGEELGGGMEEEEELTEVRVVVEDVSGDEDEEEEDEDEEEEEEEESGKGGGRAGRPGGVSLPLLQVWPIDRGLADGSSFVFPPKEEVGSGTEERRDSGIDSFQASPIGECSSNGSGAGGSRRESTHTFTGSRLLHPNSARFLRRSSSDRSLNAASSGVGGDDYDDDEEHGGSRGLVDEDGGREGDDEGDDGPEEEEEEEEDLLTVEAATACARARFSAWSRQLAQERSARCNNSDQPPASPLLLPVSVTHAIPTARRRSSASSYARRASSASSARSDAAPWPCSPPPSSCSSRASRRRVSLLMDALDLEYSTRGSVGGVRSFSGSFQKLTFTQSLAFPGLAAVRGLRSGHGDPPRRNRRSFSSVSSSSTARSGLNAFAKVVTTVVLVLISVLVFGVVYKYVRT